jgi:hypothetical protein
MSAAATLDDYTPTERPDRGDALPPGVELEPADHARGCGALGCRTVAPLFAVSVDGVGIRTLCLKHASEFLQKKAGVDLNRFSGWWE